MTPSTHEPLTPEERDLAQRLSRLGPHGGPSPALDATILAAAHAAVAAAPSRRRWWAITGIPGSLVTGAGMAATLALVVGVVWQLRPSSPPAQLPADDGDMGYISAEIIKPDASAAASAKAPPPPPVEPPRVLSADAAATAPAPAPARRQAPQHRAETAVAAADTSAAAATASAPAQDSAVAAGDYATETYAAAPMVAATPPAEMQARQRAKEAADREATAQLDRVEVTGARVAAAKAMAAPPAPAAAPAAAPQAFHEVAASTAALADIPVREDSALGIDDWVERIRARRDAGNLDDARASLAAFRDAHPKHRLPDDLRELAQSTR